MTIDKSIRSSLKTNLHATKKGFTLVEILIVLALIGIVAGLAMSNLGGIFGSGKVQAAQTWVNSTGEAYINSYFALVGDYPKSLSDLRTPPNGLPPFVTVDCIATRRTRQGTNCLEFDFRQLILVELIILAEVF